MKYIKTFEELDNDDKISILDNLFVDEFEIIFGLEFSTYNRQLTNNGETYSYSF